MPKIIFITLLFLTGLYADAFNASIARNKSGFFIGGQIGLVSASQESWGSKEIRETVYDPGISNLKCEKLPNGMTSCTGHNVLISPSTSVTDTFEFFRRDFKEITIGYGGRVGYNLFLTLRNGLRFIGALNFSNLNMSKDKYNVFEGRKNNSFYVASIGVDYLFDFTKGKSPFGIFIGLGYDYNFGPMFEDLKRNAQKKSDIKNSGVYVNFGISQTISRRLRIELGYKALSYDYFKGCYEKNYNEIIDVNHKKEIHEPSTETISANSFYMAVDILF